MKSLHDLRIDKVYCGLMKTFNKITPASKSVLSVVLTERTVRTEAVNRIMFGSLFKQGQINKVIRYIVVQPYK